MQPSDDTNPKKLLPLVLENLPSLVLDANVAEVVFLAIRNAALRPQPSLPHVDAVLVRVSAVAVSAAHPRIRSTATAASASLAILLSRVSPSGPARASAYLHGLCQAISDLRQSIAYSRRTAPFLREFGASADISTGVPGASIANVPASRIALRAALALIARLAPCPSRPHAEPHEPLLAAAFWRMLGDRERAFALRTAAHPALLTGRAGAAVAKDASIVVCQLLGIGHAAPVIRACVTASVVSALKFHARHVRDVTGVRKDVVVLLLKALLLAADPYGLPSAVWADIGIPFAVLGKGEVANAAFRIIREERVANVPPEDMFGCVQGALYWKEREQNDKLLERPSKRPRTSYISNERTPLESVANGVASGAGSKTTNPSNITNSNSTIQPTNNFSGENHIGRRQVAERNTYFSERPLLNALMKQFERAVPRTDPSDMRIFERLCLLASSRCGLWKINCDFDQWCCFAGRLISAVTAVFRLATSAIKMKQNCRGSFGLAKECLYLIYGFLRGFRDADESRSPVSGEVSEIESFMTKEEFESTCRDYISCVLDFLDSIISIGRSACGLVDIAEIPAVVRQLAQFVQEPSVFSSVVHDDFSPRLCKVCLGLQTIAIDDVSCEETGGRSLGLLTCNGALLLVCPIFKMSESEAAFEQLHRVIEACKPSCGRCASKALGAISNCICVSARCRGNHKGLSSSSLPLSAGTEIWSKCHALVQRILSTSDSDDVLSSAAECLGRLVIHASSSKADHASSQLVKCVWHPSSPRAQRQAMNAIEILSPLQENRNNGNNAANLQAQLSCRSSTLRSPDDTWDGPEQAFKETNSGDTIAKRLGTELNVQLHKSVLGNRKSPNPCLSLSAQGSSASKTRMLDLNPTSFGLVARLPAASTAAAKASGIALDVLITGAVSDLMTVLDCSVESPESTNQNEHLQSRCPRLKFWNELLSVAAHIMNHNRYLSEDFSALDESVSTRPWLSPSAAKGLAPFRGSSIIKGVLSSELASFLNARMKDWLPFTLLRMLSNPGFDKVLASILLEPSEDSLWKKVPRFALGAVLRDGNANALDALAKRLKNSRKSLVDIVCADALARNALISPNGLDLRPNGPNKLIQEVMQQPLAAIVHGKAGKIVQRIVMELGGARDPEARRALDSLTRILSPQTGSSQQCMSAGDLVAQHFMLVMDATTRGLLLSKVPEPERLRYLSMLDAILCLTKDQLHLFVPKILATLKMCLDTHVGGDRFRAKSIDVWATFLNCLGPKRVKPHLGSMLALLLPQVQKFSPRIVPVLQELFDKGQTHLKDSYPEVLLLFRTVTHSSLREITSFLTREVEKEKDDAGGENEEDDDVVLIELPVQDNGERIRNSDGQRSSTRKYEESSLEFLNVAMRHESPEIRAIALDQLLLILRSNRDKLHLLITGLGNDESAAMEGPPLLALLITNLTSLVAGSQDGCNMKAFQCLGELGAIDPGLIMKHSNNCSMEGSRETRAISTKNSVDTFPKTKFELARCLLEGHLVPALWRSDGIGSSAGRVNRIGLAIQELLKVCHCDQDTPMLPAQVTNGDGLHVNGNAAISKQKPAGSTKRAGIEFWSSLSDPIQIAAQPYLLEPFDVQKYASVFGGGKMGDLNAASCPVWDRVKTAQDRDNDSEVNEWRRLLVSQLIDFVGGDGEFGPLFKALRPVLRYEHGIVSCLFSYVVMTALGLEKKTQQSKKLLAFVASELQQGLKAGPAAVQSVLAVLDTLRLWRDDRCHEQAAAFVNEQIMRQKMADNMHNGRRRLPERQPLAYVIETRKESDPLTSLVDLDGREAKIISLLHQAQAAVAARAYPRAIFLAEQHIRNTRFNCGNYSWPAFMGKLFGGGELLNGTGSAEKRFASQTDQRQENLALSVLQKAFAELEDADSLAGISALRRCSTLSESIIDDEASGNFDEALLNYERALGQHEVDEKLQSGFLRCLCTLGHWETMLAHAIGVTSMASVSESSKNMQQSAKALGIEAAWRLGRWDHVDELSQIGSFMDVCDHSRIVEKQREEIGSGEAIGRTLMHIHRKQWDLADQVIKRARTALLAQAKSDALEGYSRAYPSIVQLHSLADVEDLAQILKAKERGEKSQSKSSGLVTHLDGNDLIELAGVGCRSSVAASSLRVREPLLSTRRACLEMLGHRSKAADVSIEFARLAMASGNLRAAAASAFRALSNTEDGDAASFTCATEMAKIQRARGDDAGALLGLRKVIEKMTLAHTNIVNELAARARGTKASASSQDAPKLSLESIKERLCRAHVLAGLWIEEARSESPEVILWHYRKATEYGPTSEDAFYSIGRYYDSLLQAGAAASGDGGSGKTRSSQARNSFSSTPTGRGNATEVKKNHLEYVPLVIDSFTSALCHGYSRIYEALPRLLTVWFDFYSDVASASNTSSVHGVEPLVKQSAKAAFAGIPTYMWMTVIPQLLSRLLHPSQLVRNELSRLLANVVMRFPDQCVWTVFPSSQLHAQDRKLAVVSVLNLAIHNLKRKGTGSGSKAGKSGPRSKSSILGSLGSGSTPGGTAGGVVTAQSREAAERLRTKINGALGVLKDLINVCLTQAPKEKRGRRDNCADEFVSVKKSLGLSSIIVPTLHALTVCLPSGNGKEHRAFAADPVTIVDVEDTVLVMNSLMRPRRIGFRCSDGRSYRFLAKRETAGDMRKDSRLVDFVTVVNRLLSKDKSSRQRELQLKTYAVIPLTEETGMIEWVNDLASLRSLVREEQSCIGNVPDSSMIQSKYDSEGKNKRGFLEHWALVKFPPMLDKFFVRRFARNGDAAAWLRARTAWSNSVAAWSMTGYVIGLGDRHGENVLIETTTGTCVHVDFALLFEKGLTLKVPEVVPFRLTPNMVGALGVAGTEGAFGKACEACLKVLRVNSDALLGVLESFLHDPLADWNRGASGNRYALQTRSAVRAKLRGIVDGSGIPLSIQGQVQKIVADATSLDNLAKMYLWWSAWV